MKRHFFPILGTTKTEGGNALGDAHERPGFRPKSSPSAVVVVVVVVVAVAAPTKTCNP